MPVNARGSGFDKDRHGISKILISDADIDALPAVVLGAQSVGEEPKTRAKQWRTATPGADRTQKALWQWARTSRYRCRKE